MWRENIDDLKQRVQSISQLSPDNKVFLTSRLAIGSTETLAEPHRRSIRRELNPNQGFPCLDLRAARKALNDFKKSRGDSRAVADLIIYYVGQGVSCTRKYGSIDEPFFNSLESVFEAAIKLINETADAEIIEEFYPRLEKIVAYTHNTGWGFYDTPSEVFYSEYPQPDGNYRVQF